MDTERESFGGGGPLGETGQAVAEDKEGARPEAPAMESEKGRKGISNIVDALACVNLFHPSVLQRAPACPDRFPS